MISIDKYPKSASFELEPEEIQNRIKARDLQLSLKHLQNIYLCRDRFSLRSSTDLMIPAHSQDLARISKRDAQYHNSVQVM